MNKILYWPLICSMVMLAAVFTGCSDDDDEYTADYLLTIAEEDLNIAVEAETTYYEIELKARAIWKATVTAGNEEGEWLTLVDGSGMGGYNTLSFSMEENTGSAARTATITVTCASASKDITVTQGGSNLTILDESDVENLDMYYKPAEFSGMDMLRSDAKWSWTRSRQSDHFFVFWEAGFGDDPNSSDVPPDLRVDIDDLLEKAEQFYRTNVETLGFIETGRSYLDRYKMQIYLLYQTEWLATGSGYDNVIGALWVNPATCQPVGSTIGHEIGHSFQYQVYCDKLYRGGADDFLSGFRYGYEGSNGGNGFWEQCAQWQSFIDYPDEVFNYYFDTWLQHCHRHFENEWMRYASYWLQYYWSQLHGMETVGRIWNESASPEDAIGAYMRIYNGNDWEATRRELYDYAARMATFDIDLVRDYAGSYQGRYSTQFYTDAEGYYQVSYGDCPGTTGFNVIALNVPGAGSTVSVDFEGLPAGAALAADDPGEYLGSDGESGAGTTGTYNNRGAGLEGWAYGFVTLKADGTRDYGEMNTASTATVAYTVPSGTERLFLVVQGSPSGYRQSPWDENELTDDQWPYRVRFDGTDLYGNVDIDTGAEPQSITLAYDLPCDAGNESYELGAIDLQATGGLTRIAQAFAMQPSQISANTQGIAPGSTASPAEGRITLGLLQPDGTVSYTYTANGGFYCTADGYAGSWSDGDPVWFEYDPATFVVTYGHFPGQTVAGRTYTMQPVLAYVKDGTEYHATLRLNLNF